MSKRNIYFGSLEDQLPSEEKEVNSLVSSTNISNSNFNYSQSQAPHSQPQQPQPPQNSAASEEFDRRSLAKTLQIPTDDPTVRRLLISLNQPMTLFGEGPAERRDRLRLMASRAICSLPRAFELFPVLRTLCGQNTTESQSSDDDDDEEFYVPGSVDLIKVRSFLLDDSIRRSHSRQSSLSPLDRTTEHVTRTELYDNVKKELDLKATFMDANGRPLSVCAFTANGDLFTGDWSGRVLKYSNSSSEVVYNAGDRITAMCADNSGRVLFGTASGKIQIQIHQGTRSLSLPTTHAIKSLNWHPSDRFFASASADSLWRLWDAVEGTELQVQEGHVDGISSGAWHPDGAIYATGGTSDGLIRLWDCRMGKAIWTIPGRPNIAISALTFSPLQAHLLASAETDGFVHFHDLRKVQADYLKTAAHRSCCSGLKFIAGGRIIASTGFDGNLRLWCPGDLRLVHDLPVASAKVTGFDAQSDNLRLAAISFDRSVKIFST